MNGRKSHINKERGKYKKSGQSLRELLFDWNKKFPHTVNSFLDDFTEALKDENMTSKNSSELRKNMDEAYKLTGKSRYYFPPGKSYHAHHIVPSTHTYESADSARTLLEDNKISINNHKNGVALDQPSHSGLHTNKYMDAVYNILSEADNIDATLDFIANRLQKGKKLPE